MQFAEKESFRHVLLNNLRNSPDHGSQVRICLHGAPFSDLHFVTSFFKNSKSGIDNWGHYLRSGSQVTIYSCTPSPS